MKSSNVEARDQKTTLKSKLLQLWNLWPPFIGAGISIDKVEGNWDGRGDLALEVKLKLRFWNSNYVGTQFGGSLFAMTDPFYMVMLARRLGREFVVWDKSASIRYRRPGTSDCRVRFELKDGEIESLKEEVRRLGKLDWNRSLDIRDKEGKVVAQVDKVLYIATREAYLERKKSAAPT